MNFEGFSTVEFPPINPDVPGFVYVWCWINGSEEVPFYVGQTGRLWGRLDDYYWAMFSAPTDFRVGEAIRYLSARGYRITVKYKSSAAPLEEEAKIKRLFGNITSFSMTVDSIGAKPKNLRKDGKSKSSSTTRWPGKQG